MKSPSYDTDPTVNASLLSPHRKQLGCGIVGIVPTLDLATGKIKKSMHDE